MKARGMDWTRWASMLMLQLVFAHLAGPAAWPFHDHVDLSAVVFWAAVVLCALSLWEAFARRWLNKTRAVLWALVIGGFCGPRAWPFAEDGGVFFAIAVVLCLGGCAGIVVHDMGKHGGNSMKAELDTRHGDHDVTSP